MVNKYPVFKLASKQYNKVLSLYQDQVHQQQVLITFIRSTLPDTLKNHAQYCVIKHKQVVIYTTSATWASQLRFHTSAMLATLHNLQKTAHFENIQIRIMMPTPVITTNPRNPNKPSIQMIKIIGESRAHHKDTLGEALTSLSRTLEKYCKVR